MTKIKTEIASHMTFEEIRYSQVWEDINILREGLQINYSDTILSITSGGCNVLGLLLDNPDKIVAIDLNPSQIALLELKIACFRNLQYIDTLKFLGVIPSDNRQSLYARLRKSLAEQDRVYWDKNKHLIEKGVIHCGRLEHYFHKFINDILPDIVDPQLIKRLLNSKSMMQQRRLLDEIMTDNFNTAFKSYFGRESMSEEGRDPAQFKYVDITDVGAYFLDRFQTVCSTLTLKDNFYIHYFLTGYYDIHSLPTYLNKGSYEIIRTRLDRIEIREDNIETVLQGEPQSFFSKVNCSDIFEYMGEENSAKLFEILMSRVAQHGRIAYWNLLVNRQPPEELSGYKHLNDLSANLWQKDRSWFYRTFQIEEVV
jgi:S-adenosylmethionine-diacylglycerol 3-amino-3-carboxypropyl transferase